VQELLARRPPGADAAALFVAHRDGLPVTTDWLRNCVRKVMEQAGFPAKYRPHALRGMGSSRALDAGMPQGLVELQFRWSPASGCFQRFYLRSQCLDRLGQCVYA